MAVDAQLFVSNAFVRSPLNLAAHFDFILGHLFHEVLHEVHRIYL